MCFYLKLDMIEFLLKNNANANQKDANGRSCLHIASHIGYADAVSLLLKYNADIELVDNDGRTPLLTAVWNDNLEIVKRLLDAKAELNHQDLQGATALSIGTLKGNYNIVLELLTHGALIYASSKNPIQIAVKCEYHNIAKLLEQWSVTTGQKPPSAPRTSKSLDSFRCNAKTTERRIMATIAVSNNKKDKLKNSHLMSYQCSNQIIPEKTTTESYCPRTTTNGAVTNNVSSKNQSSIKNFLLKRSNTSTEKNSKNERQFLIGINNKNFFETSAVNNSSIIQVTPVDSTTSKTKTNKFLQMIRKKFKFFKFNNNESTINETKRTMHRSVTDSIAHKKSTADDAAFIFNRTSINEYFNQRSSFKEYNNNDNTTDGIPNSPNKMEITYSERITDSKLIKTPNRLPMNYFKKETSI